MRGGVPMADEEKKNPTAGDAAILFESGSMKRDELEAILDTVPFDLTFVDAEDRVVYFNQSPERIFPRKKGVLGKKVQQCHPEKSVHLVTQIVDDFKSGTRDKAEFWIPLGERLVYIRYFPVKDKEGRYLGCLEVSQDIAGIKEISGEKRLL
jgi:PAS domain S-box-containing protein